MKDRYYHIVKLFQKKTRSSEAGVKEMAVNYHMHHLQLQLLQKVTYRSNLSFLAYPRRGESNCQRPNCNKL